MTTQNNLSQSLYEALMVEMLPKLAISGGKHSISIVNNINGKRVTFSKALAERLELSDNVSVMPSTNTRKIVLGKTLPFPNALNVNLSDKGKKIAYNAQLVEVLTKVLELDFSNCTSRSFGDIIFDELEGVPIAIVNVP